jgi:hypothetical protein
MSETLDRIGESQSVCWEAVRRVAESREFGVTGAGELDLGLDDTTAPACGDVPDVDLPVEDLIDRGWEPGDDGDPETDPDDFEAWLAGMPAEVRADFLAGPFTGEGGPIPAGLPAGVGHDSPDHAVVDLAGWWRAR